MIVVDTSVVLAALLGHRAARVALSGQRLLAPAHIDVEVAHALRGLVRGGKLDHPNAAVALDAWRALAIDRIALPILLPRVWALRENLTAYDAAFVAAAEMYAVPLATADRRLANAVGPRCSIQLIPR